MKGFSNMSDTFMWSGSATFPWLLRFLQGREPASFAAALCRNPKTQTGHFGPCLLDLPDLAIENILFNLPPDSLCRMATVCKKMREKCSTDYLWEPHVMAKWGKIAGPDAYQEWLDGHDDACEAKAKILIRHLVWRLSHLWSSSKRRASVEKIHGHSYMHWYRALEMGAFSFRAQVYNREHKHCENFVLSCYDARFCYDCRTDTFTARYGSEAIEEDVQWERLRVPPIGASPYEVHISDCLLQLQPEDHVEVQWKRSKDHLYGWWYAVVGHSDTCDRETPYCHCHLDDVLWLEFNQYTSDSGWRRTAINRTTHVEKGDENEGYFAGIRKLCSKSEISTWKHFWPDERVE